MMEKWSIGVMGKLPSDPRDGPMPRFANTPLLRMTLQLR